MSALKNNNKLEYTLTQKNIYTISAYYILLIVLGIIVSAYTMMNVYKFEKKHLFFFAIVSSIAVSSMLCSVQYLKRIYKACIDNRVTMPTKESPYIHLGNLLYFFLRPIFACVFTIIAIFSILSGFIVITSSVDYILNDKFLYLCVIVSSFIGFSIGSVLDAFEVISDKNIISTLKNNHGGDI